MDDRAEREHPVAASPSDTPAFGVLADADDTRVWDRARHGRMEDYADLPTLPTIPYTPGG